MEKVKQALAIILGKTLLLLTRVSGKGGGTALPGLIANFAYPCLISNLTRDLEHGSIVVTGTNGKTTTTRILSSILTEAGFSPIHNRAGSNLMRGVASALIEVCSFSGKINGNIGIWEIDEAALPYAIKDLRPKIVVITNLFRDQLDRYGEIDKVVSLWKDALKNIAPETIVVLCGDDPTVASLGSNLENLVFFGISDKNLVLQQLPHAADSKQCPFCGRSLAYKRCFASHLGDYNCLGCSYKRPILDINCLQAKFSGIDSTQIWLNTPLGQLNFNINLSGLYNIYNVEASVAVAVSLEIPFRKIKNGLEKFKPAFGRLEKVNVDQKTLYLFLSKNPTGFNEVIRTVLWDEKPKNVIIAINDLIADGRDISWLWDVDFEMMRDKIKTLVLSGVRAEDMALRLKYGEVRSKQWTITTKDLKKAITVGLAKLDRGETLYILPTYTAMLEIRKVLYEMGLTHKSWED